MTSWFSTSFSNISNIFYHFISDLLTCVWFKPFIALCILGTLHSTPLMYATQSKTWAKPNFYYTDRFRTTFWACLSVCPSIRLASLYWKVVNFEVFWWNLVYLRVLAQGRTLVNTVRISPFFRALSIVLPRRYMDKCKVR